MIYKCLIEAENNEIDINMNSPKASRSWSVLFFSFLRKAGINLRATFWVIPGLGKLLLSGHTQNKRLLLIYDLSTQPFSIGDILTLQEASMVLRLKFNVDLVDVAIVSNVVDLKLNDAVFNKINSNNYFYHLASILPVAQVNPFLGSIFCFNSQDQLEAYVSDNIERYEIWPTGWKAIFTKEYLYYSVFEEVLLPYFERTGAVPSLTCRPHFNEWAKQFFKDNANSNIPVTVNIRNNPYHQKERNLNLEEWIQFFKDCEHIYPIVFFVICAKSEIDDRLRGLSNVVIAKDFDTNLELELALISCSAFHMGAPSGPVMMAVFGDNPYFIVRGELHLQHFTNPKIAKFDQDGSQRFFFSKIGQKFMSGAESSDMLMKNFLEMLKLINHERWLESCESKKHDKVEMRSWLR